MKKFIFLALGCLFLLSSCSSNEQSKSQQQYTDYTDPGGQHYVQVQNNDGTSFFMQYLLFHSLMNMGGYNSVNHYYHSYPSDPRCSNNIARFSTWKKSPSPYNIITRSSSYNKPSITYQQPYKPTSTSYSRSTGSSYKSSSYSRPSSTSSSWSSPSRSSSYSRSYTPSRSSSFSRSFSSGRSSSFSRRR